LLKVKADSSITIKLASLCLFLIMASACFFAFGQSSMTVTGRVELAGEKLPRSKATSTVVVWLTPLSSTAHDVALKQPVTGFKLTQKNKSFQPHLLVVPVGATVEFPNTDPWFHNVFSLFEGKRFDLGLYEAGTSRKVHFDRTGVSYIFCNIHPQMSAVVVVLDTPYYQITRSGGAVSIPNVPPGRYRLQIWNEAALPETLNALSREITISESQPSFGTIKIEQTGDLLANHTNKYGREYENPDPSNPIYSE
jgi:plastocyanin